MKSQNFLSVLFAIVLTLPIGERPCYSGGEEHEESPSGASFKVGKGVLVTDETKKILGLEVTDVTEENLPEVITFNTQVYGEKHRFEAEDVDHSGCEIHGSGLLPQDRASSIQPKQSVELLSSTGDKLEGFVVAVKKDIVFGETEILIGVTSAGAKVKDGEFLKATITLPRDEAVTMIPRSALLRTAQGTFVYAVNGEAYIRTAVKIGSVSTDKIEIVDGLFAGDQVVTKPVETLWLIELRATKGGGHCH